MGRLFYEHHYNVLVDALNAVDVTLENCKVLDFGCGTGEWLRLLVEMGANPEYLTGIDLSESRIESARKKNPSIDWRRTEGDRIPFESSQFDLVMQVVVFSSIIDRDLAQTLLAEMLRVTKPGGYLLWIDHKKNHSPSLSGYTVQELIEYLPGTSLVYQESVHPRYFRSRHHSPWLCRSFYHFFKFFCDSWLLVFRKEI
jgi:ubiquinone/menaquinone biosynthesis C-methylase UbiE